MPKPRIGIAALLLAILVSGAALGKGGGGGHGGGGGGHGGGGHGGGHFGGGHFGGGHFGGAHFGGGHFGGHSHFAGPHRGGAHFATSRSFSRGGYHSGRSFAQHGGVNLSHIHNAPIRSANIHNALNSFSHGSALQRGRLLSNPATRAQIATGAALAGWHGGSIANGWWRHGNGGFGWVGPLFWPFAYYDLYDYTIWGDYGFWYYGYPDLYAGIFGPYGYDDLTGYFPQRAYRRHPRISPLMRMCGDDSRDVAGVPIDQIAQAVQPNEAQRATLDDLGNASIQAAQIIRAACPTQVVLTAPGRLTAMQSRIEAMISAVATVRPPLEKLYGLLNDEQKARFNAVAQDQRKRASANSGNGVLAQNCGTEQSAAFQWPADDIEAKLHPNDTQRAALNVLQDTSAKAADMLKAACQPDDALSPPARLDAAAKRLDTMLQAVKSVRAALDDFYATLSDEQKAQFEAIGVRRTA